MAGKLPVQIIAPDKRCRFDEAVYAEFHSETGSMGVLPGHADMMGQLSPGRLVVREAGGGESVFSFSGGFFEIRDGELTMMVDSVERKEEIDVERAREARKRAEERLAKARGQEWDRARAALMRALNRLRVAEG